MIDKKIFKKSFGAPLEKAGFIKKGQSWYLKGKDAIAVLNLQKCDWGDWYYINIGIWLKALGEASFPKENQCHLNYRAERIFPQKRGLILDSCSLEKTNSELLTQLSLFIESDIIPFLSECTDEEKLKNLITRGVINEKTLFQKAREHLLGNI